MKNIFENAKFGDKFRIGKNNKEGVLLKITDHNAYVWIKECDDMEHYNLDGTVIIEGSLSEYNKNFLHESFDIVSKHEQTFDGKEMKKFISVTQDWGDYIKVTIMYASGEGVVDLFVYDDSDTAEIGGLYVIPSMRGKGLAKLLIAEAEKKAKELGAMRTKLLAESHLTTFYKELGYREDKK